MIIDSHSHFGTDYYFGKVDIYDYIKCCNEINITTGFLMPCPWPNFIDNSGNIVTSLIWEHDNYIHKRYYSICNNEKTRVYSNPYKEVNYYSNSVIESVNTIDLRFVPLLHGVLDTPEYLEKLLFDLNPPAIKIHGFASGFSPEDINPELIEIIKQFNIPLILHTSVYNYDYGYGASTRFFRNECHPKRWADFLMKNNLRGVLNHGACLNKEAIEEANRNDKIMIGIGPDLDISRDYFKVDIEKDIYTKSDYLELLKSKIPSEKLLFDIDFGWNNEGEKYDISQEDRLSKVWSSNELNNILYKNALYFFDIGDNGIKNRSSGLTLKSK